MKFLKAFLLLLGFSSFFSCTNESGKNIDFVDPMIGTNAHGHTFPGATTPFGMVQLSPSNDFKAWDWCSGYHYSDSILKGFAHTHISGAGLAGLGDFLFMPTSGELNVKAGTEKDPDSGFRSRFSHQQEEASAGYYSVLLSDYNIKVELTATPRVGVHRYTKAEAGSMHVIVDPTHNISERIFDAGTQVLSDTEIQGYKIAEGEAGKRKVFFYAKFSKPFAAFGVAQGDTILQNKKQDSGLKMKSFVSFDMQAEEQLEVKVALSHVSFEGAKKNLLAEAESENFDRVLTQAQALWAEKLNKIDIETADIADKRTFYTGMYHAYISPNIISDVDGKYVVEGKEYQSDFVQFSNFSTWDTYRALHPLFTIIEQKTTANFVNSLSSRYTVSKVGLPVWELLGHDNACMIGYNTVSPIAEAILKGIEGINTEDAYQAIHAAAMSTEKHSPNYDKNGMDEYLKLNYISSNYGSSVSKTTEQNYYDWCIAQVAKKMGNAPDAKLFEERSTGYRHLYNTQHKYLYPKKTTGEWVEMDMTVWDDMKRNYISGNIWGYSSYVPHDMAGLIELTGGKEAFNLWLDKIFNDTTAIGGHQHVDISGFIGKYGHGDEPSQHLPYLYNYSGQAWKTQALIPQVLNSFYNDSPEGHINNEDLGQMSAWYIFSSLGFYPVNPASQTYIIGSPHFKQSTLRLENGHSFTVIANNVSDNNIYIQSAMLNGKVYSKSYISHQDIMQGGTLEFEMGSKPNKMWGAAAEDLPVSKVDIPIEATRANSKMTFTPYDTNTATIFETNREIELACNTKAATVYYSVNGQKPTITSKKYTAPLQVKNNMNIKAVAYTKDKGYSFFFEKQYLRGKKLRPEALHLAHKASGYGKDDGRQLVDQQIASALYADGKWTGWNGLDMEATITLPKKQAFENISVGFLTSPGTWIFPPKSIDIYASDNGKDFQKIATQHIAIDENHPKDPFVTRKVLSLKGNSGKYIKVIARNWKQIPEWHGASGHAPWMFIDEIIWN